MKKYGKQKAKKVKFGFTGRQHTAETKSRISDTQKRRQRLIEDLLKRHEAEAGANT